jgi:hypothetical protein
MGFLCVILWALPPILTLLEGQISGLFLHLHNANINHLFYMVEVTIYHNLLFLLKVL